jgi:hypothetical protein
MATMAAAELEATPPGTTRDPFAAISAGLIKGGAPKRALPSSTELDLWKPAVLAFVTSGLFETNFKGLAQPLEGGGILPHILVAASEARGDLASRAKAMLKALAGGNGGVSSSSAATAASRAAEGGASAGSESGGAGGAAGATSTRSGDAAVARREASTPTLLRWLQEESVVLALVVLATGDPGRGVHSSQSSKQATRAARRNTWGLAAVRLGNKSAAATGRWLCARRGF